MTHSEYMSFFERWLQYQFPRVEDDWDNFYILKTVAAIVRDDDDLKDWSNRDCWSMYYHAKEAMEAKA
jgi:hypothetical protein